MPPKNHPALANAAPTSAMPDVVRLWVLRILVPLNGHRDFLDRDRFQAPHVAEAIGLSKWLGSSRQELDIRAVRASLRRRFEIAERKLSRASLPLFITENVSRLAKLIGLTDVDCRLLEFAAILHTERVLDDAAEYLGGLTSNRLYYTLSVILGIPEAEVKAALSPKGLLARSSLLIVDRTNAGCLRGKLDLLTPEFADRLLTALFEPTDLLRDAVLPSTAGTLTLADYPHIAGCLAVLRPYLQHCLQTGRRGVNILIHGTPGTGKSQLAKALAHEAKCELFEIASENGNGDPVDGEQRLRAFRAAQHLFTKRTVMMVFDEAEDVFHDGDNFFGRKSTAQTHKAWLNRALEDNPVPTVWLSNSISGIDSAFIRRFDMVFELPVPPKKLREQLLTTHCSDLIGKKDIVELSELAELAPAVMTRAASVVRAISHELDDEGTGKALKLLLSNTLEAQGHQSLQRQARVKLPDTYDPQFINADTCLQRIADGQKEVRCGRLCLYGPPGTGKTAYGHWLAEYLEMPLVIKRASDLLSKWVGGSEKCIASAFREATEDGAILMIDEVDSFLQDRHGAKHSWEITSVNEMLTQMETYQGIFIASTNLIEGLDAASLRRFDLKVKFDFLHATQAAAMLTRIAVAMQLNEPTAEDFQALRSLDKLTPGDFAVVNRQHRFQPFRDSGEVVHALRRECAAKNLSTARPIGFLSQPQVTGATGGDDFRG